MFRHTVALALIGSLGALVTWGACGGTESASPTRDGGVEAGGSGGSGGGVTGGKAGMGATGGTGGTSADAGEWGPAPVWESFPGTAAGCTFERMTNAASIRFLKWEPCSWTDGCEQAVFNPVVFGSNVKFGGNKVFDDGNTVRASLTSSEYQHRMAAFLGDDGMGLDGFRVASGAFDCIDASSIWGPRFAVHVSDLSGSNHFGGILGDIGVMANPPATFTIPEPPPVGGTQGYVLGTERWLWWWAPADRFSTVSAKDGSGFQIFAAVTFQSTAQMLVDPITTGPLFVAQEYDILDGGQQQAKLVYSDGIAPMKPYLVPASLNDDYGSAAFANTHIGFMKGINRKDLNLYDSVEIWATPYSTNPSALKPSLVGAYPNSSMGYLVGGWGHLGTIEGLLGGPLDLAIWSISTKTVRKYPPFPADHYPNPILGVTRTHLWVGGLVNGDDKYLMRFKVE